MRTTITLDPDVELMLKNVMRERDVTFKYAVNNALRAGLKSASGRPTRFLQQTFSLGAGQAFRWDKALEMASALEDDEFGSEDEPEQGMTVHL
jgi:Arc/MetJ family transcription regulator